MRYFFTYSCYDVTLWHRILKYDVWHIILEKHSKKQSLFFRRKPPKCPAQQIEIHPEAFLVLTYTSESPTTLCPHPSPLKK